MNGNSDRIEVRVYYEDTDFSGVVYHASYLRFLERGRTEYLRARGIHQQAITDGSHGPPFAFAVRRMTLDFRKAARMDDLLTVHTSPGELRGASVYMHQRILRGEDTVLSADVVVACVADGKPARIPAWVRDKLS